MQLHTSICSWWYQLNKNFELKGPGLTTFTVRFHLQCINYGTINKWETTNIFASTITEKCFLKKSNLNHCKLRHRRNGFNIFIRHLSKYNFSAFCRLAKKCALVGMWLSRDLSGYLRANVAKNQTFSKYCGNSSKINSAHILVLGRP